MRRETRRIVLAAVLTGVMSGGAGRARAGVVYSTGFEPTTFTAGGLNNQGGWNVAGVQANTVVEGTFARSGQQAVEIVAAGNPDNAGAFRGVSTAGPIVDVSADQYFNTAGTPTSRQGFEILTPGGGLVADAEQLGDGTIALYSARGQEIFAGPGRNAWHNWEFQINFSLQTVSLLIDGTTIAAGRPLEAAATSVGNIAFLDIGTGGDQRFLDNVSVTDNSPGSVPEPASVLSAATGLATILGYAWLRRRRLDA